MSIPLKLFLAISLERKSVFRDVRVKASERNKMADSVEISFVDENDFLKVEKWYFLRENSQWEISSTLCRRLERQRFVSVLSGIT